MTGYTRAAVVNAGDGKHQHPTQALLDLYTIRKAVGHLEGLHVAIVGDVLHSRVARSNMIAFAALRDARHPRRAAGADPARTSRPRASRCRHDIADIASADVVYVLRMQRERMLPGEAFVPSLREYAQRYCVTPGRVRPGQLVMHPGPMNRGVEIDGEVADSAASLIAEQVRSGLVVRMAVLYDLLLGSSVPAPLVARARGGRVMRGPGPLTVRESERGHAARARCARRSTPAPGSTRASTCSCATASSPRSETTLDAPR